MRPSFQLILAIASLLLLTGGLRADLPPGLAGGGLKGNEAYLDGSFFLTAPVRSSIGEDGALRGSLWLIEPYVSWGEQGEVATSLGLAWRHLFGNQPVSAMTEPVHGGGFFGEGVFVGANLFLDSLDTQFDNRFWQAGGGLELGSRYLELRTNYYRPMTGPQDVDTWTRDSQSELISTHYADPRASGHGIEQEIGYGLYQVTTHLDRHFVGSEAGLEGWDAEVAVLVPWIDQWAEVRMIPGYYRFQNQPFGRQTGGTGETEGWRLGMEVRPVPALALHATWYEDPAWTGQDWMAGFRAEVPFEIGDCGDGEGFWDRIHDGFRPRRRHLAERLIEPVKRQNTAVRTDTQVVEDVAARKVTQEIVTRREDRRETNVLLKDVIFLNGGGATENGIGAGRSNGDGTAQRPFQYGSDAAAAAIQRGGRTGRIWTVYAEGSAKGIDEDYDRQGYWLAAEGGRGFRLVGSGELLKGAGGVTFGSGVAPWFGEIKVANSDFFEVSGVMAGEILCDRVQAVWIHDNRIGLRYSPFTYFIFLTALRSTGGITLASTPYAVVERNQVWNPIHGVGIVVRSIGDDNSDGTSRVYIRNNVIRAVDYGIEVHSITNQGLTEVSITDNVILDATKAGVRAWDGISPSFGGPGIVRINSFRGNTMRNGGTELITDFSNPSSYVRR